MVAVDEEWLFERLKVQACCRNVWAENLGRLPPAQLAEGSPSFWLMSSHGRGPRGTCVGRSLHP